MHQANTPTSSVAGKRKTRGTISSPESDVSPQVAQEVKRAKAKQMAPKSSDTSKKGTTESLKIVDPKMVSEMNKMKEETIEQMKNFMSQKFDQMAETMCKNIKDIEEKLGK